MAQNDNWTGGAGSGDAYWDLSTNWNSGVPVSASNAIIGSAYDPEIRTNAGSILTLQDSGGLSIIAGGALNTTSTTVTSFIDGAFSLNGGTLGGSGTTTISGASNWTGGSIGTGSTTGVVDFKGALNITGQTTKFISGDTIDTPNTTIWSGNTGALGNTIYAGDTGTTIINNTGTWKDENTFNAQMLQYSASQFNNSGIYAKSGADTTTISIPFANSGTVDVGTGATLALTGGLSNFSGSTLTGGTYNVSGVLEFPGAKVVTNAASITLAGGASALEDSGGGTNALASFAVNAAAGSFSIQSGRNFTSAGNFTNDGILAVGPGSTFATGGSLTNFAGTTLSGGTYDIGGVLEFPRANIVTNAANIALNGTSAAITNSTTSANGLANFAGNATASSFALTGGANFTTAGAFTNEGTLTVGAGSTFSISGSLTNFSGNTLTAGTYDVTGTLEFPGANIVTNDAGITLSGTAAEIENSTTKKNGLAALATNVDKGTFNLTAGASFTTVGNFSTAGVVSIGTDSTFTVGGTGVFKQTAGTTTDAGTLAASGGVAISSGSLFASGTITGNLASTGIVTPGTSATTTGILTDVGTYTQNAGGRLNIDITGLTAGTQFDVLDATTAVLGGTLNITTKYTPTVGSTFRILSFTSATGTFAAVNGLTINATEAYTVAYQPTDVLLTVVSSGAQTVDPDARLIAASDAADRGRLGEALKAFNADYAEGGRQALAAVNYATLSRQRVTEHIGALARYRAHR